MPLFGNDIFMALPVFVLVLFRIGGLLMTAPLLSSEMIPMRVRAAMAMTLALIVFPLVAPQAPADLSLSLLVIGGVTELAIGAVCGVAVSITLMAAEMAGTMVGQQAGIGLGEVFDPAMGGEVSIMGQVFSIVLVTSFLIIGGHRAMIAGVLDSYQSTPLLTGRFDESAVELLIDLLGSSFLLAIRVAGPALTAMFLTMVALSFLSRTMPQLNILSVGFQVQTMVAMGITGLAIMAMQELLVGGVWDGLDAMRGWLGVS
jgi:flagellar biosynthetic protein FliR